MNCRISRMYGPYVEAIARIFVEERERMLPSVRRVRAELGLEKFNIGRFQTWREKPEWKTALEAARCHLALRSNQSPELRGRAFLEWAKATLVELRKAYDAAKGTGEKEDDKAARDFEARIIRLSEAARAEERHLAEQHERETLRDMRRFAGALLKELADCNINESAHARLVEIAQNPTILLKE